MTKATRTHAASTTSQKAHAGARSAGLDREKIPAYGDLDRFTRNYVDVALEYCETGEPDDEEIYTFDMRPGGWDLLSDALKARIVDDCAAFHAKHASLIDAHPDVAGREFYLTRIGEGDWSSWPGADADRLRADAEAMGPFVLAVTSAIVLRRG